ncbi:MAG: hypothetical protein ACJ8D9_18110, partial [Xanthobacteraceae bacterium]
STGAWGTGAGAAGPGRAGARRAIGLGVVTTISGKAVCDPAGSPLASNALAAALLRRKMRPPQKGMLAT